MSGALRRGAGLPRLLGPILRHCPWTLAVTALAMAATTLWLVSDRQALSWLLADAGAIAAGQCWRLVTGPLLHVTVDHAVWDISMFFILGFSYEKRLGRLFPVLLAGGLVVPAAVVLFAHPELDFYSGISGLNYGLMAAVFVFEATGEDRRWVVAVAAAALAYKITRDMVCTSDMLLSTQLGPNMIKVPISHLAGVITAVLFTAGARLAEKLAAAPRWVVLPGQTPFSR